MDELPNFEIIVGTYEEFLLGYVLRAKETSYEITQSFATHDHSSSIRCVTSSGNYLASGGADDRIIIYDMKTRRELCMLDHHNATVTCLEFTPFQTHILTGSSDGVLAILRVGNWQLEKMWEKSHKGSALINLAVHPTGKLALTLGSDCILRTWNLIKGRQAYAINLNTKSNDPKSLDSIKWSPDGENFVLSGGLNVEIWNIGTGGITNKFSYDSKVICTCWLNKNVLTVGHENGKITIIKIKKEKQSTIEAHKIRIKCLECYENWLVSASSDGHIKIWKFNGKTIEEKGNCNIGCRCTCLSLVTKITKQEKPDTEEKISEEGNIEIKEKHNFRIPQKCTVIVEETLEHKNKKRKQHKTKNKNQKKIKNNENISN